MASNDENRAGARLIWAAATPFILAAGLLFLPLIPVFCVLLDARSRTYTGAVTLLVFSAAAVWLWGPMAAAVSAFIVVTTAAAYVLLRTRVPFSYGMAASAGGGVLGAMALLGIVGASLGKPLNVVASAYFCEFIKNFSAASKEVLSAYGWPDMLSITAAAVSPNQAGAMGALITVQVPKEILDMSVADKIKIVQSAFENVFSALIPSCALVGGLLTGGLAYYLPALALDRLGAKSRDGNSAVAQVPPFHSFKFPKYIIISILLVQLVTSFGGNSSVVATLYIASNAVMMLLMAIQALSLLSFFLTRKHVPTVLQVIILAPVALIFTWTWLLEFVGLFDVLFDIRAMTQRIDAVKAKGKQVFTQGGLDELRNMGRDKKNDKDSGNGEDHKK